MTDNLTILMRQILAQAETALIETERPASRVHLTLGEVADDVGDSCEDSQLNLRLIQLQAVGADGYQMSCGPAEFDATLGLGTVRCVAVLDAQGGAPTPEELGDEAAEGHSDMWALLSALCPDLYAGHFDRVISTWTPRGPQGGVIGGEWVFKVRISSCAGC